MYKLNNKQSKKIYPLTHHYSYIDNILFVLRCDEFLMKFLHQNSDEMTARARLSKNYILVHNYKSTISHCCLAHMWPLVTSLRLRARAGGAKRSLTLFVWCLRREHKMTHM